MFASHEYGGETREFSNFALSSEGVHSSILQKMYNSWRHIREITASPKVKHCECGPRTESETGAPAPLRYIS
jgi:hypothetical protein